MDKKQLLKKWLEEEKRAHIKVWDFYHRTSGCRE